MPDKHSAIPVSFGLYYTQRFLRRIRWAQAAAISLVLVFALLDVLSLPRDVWQQTLLIRFLVIIPTFALLWLASFVERWHEHFQWILSAGALIVGLGIVAILWVARREGSPLPYEGILLVAMAFYFLIGLRYPGAMVCGWLTCIVYVLAEAHAGLRGEALAYHAAFLISVNVIGSVGGYFLDSATHDNFLAQRALRDMADRDALTGLFNRRAFDDRAARTIRQALRERVRVAVAMIDIDHFKAYNDQYGHGAGDAALQRVGKVIAGSVQRPLDVAARYGGEEFVAIWFNISEDEARKLLESVRSNVQQLGLAHANSETAEVVTLSAGMASFVPGEPDSLPEGLQLADQALYMAKERGRNQVFCSGVDPGHGAGVTPSRAVG